MSVVLFGAGNMGYAILRSLRAQDPSREILVADPAPEARARAEAAGGRAFATPREALAAASEAPTGCVLLLAVKPQQAEALFSDLRPLPFGARVVSIMAGISTARIEESLRTPPVEFFMGMISGRVYPLRVHVVRAMPNTPALVGAGMTALAPGRHAREEDLAAAEVIFRAVGRVVRVAEINLDAVTAISGSGPAYFFFLAEVLEHSAREMGLDPALARTLASQTALGAGRLLVEAEEDPGTLRARVTSPGGTTAAALAVLGERRVAEAFARAFEAARDRSRELSG